MLSPASTAVVPPNYDDKAAIKVGFWQNFQGESIAFSVTGFGDCADWNTLFLATDYGAYQYAVFSAAYSGSYCCPT